jgi:hypothetical protein
MTVVARGVNRRANSALAREMQGYLFSKPLPPRELAELLRLTAVASSPSLQPADEDMDESTARSGRKRAVV